jgi:hypothetical protein
MVMVCWHADCVAACIPCRLVVQGSQVLLRLRDDQIKQLLVEFPKGACLHALDDVTARARV